MEKKSRRNRFQIHLSTAVILMFAAGGWMSAQIIPTIGNDDSDFLDANWSYADDYWPHYPVKIQVTPPSQAPTCSSLDPTITGHHSATLTSEFASIDAAGLAALQTAPERRSIVARR